MRQGSEQITRRSVQALPAYPAALNHAPPVRCCVGQSDIYDCKAY
ncbi:Uncharacterised protein [Vibrio cholerae]|nr:Uncharacterised protein [Vibrio cholerae]CSI90162.1 Uncharacterised protein [Vibrio cholerae]